jgi:hypothetical protein
MYLVRDIMYCKPGKVKDMVQKFKGVSAVMKRLGFKPFRIYTDVSAERFWTLVGETEVETLEDFAKMEEKVMTDEEARKAMSGCHDLVDQGRREIYRVES